MWNNDFGRSLLCINLHYWYFLDNGELDPTEFIRFGEVNQYYGPITAVSFFDQCNFDGEGGDRGGVVDFEEWRRCFDRLNFGIFYIVIVRLIKSKSF